MSRHTPGPWVAMRKKYSRGSEIKSSSGLIIADTWAFDVGSDVEANTRLIAAAPDLLEALKDLCSHINETRGSNADNALFAARLAISKATGEN